MKLWLLRPRVYTEDRGYMHGLWDCWYDKTFGFVISAETEAEARQMAVVDDGGDYEPVLSWARKAWLDPEQSTCTELTDEGESGIVMKDFWRA